MSEDDVKRDNLSDGTKLAKRKVQSQKQSHKSH